MPRCRRHVGGVPASLALVLALACGACTFPSENSIFPEPEIGFALLSATPRDESQGHAPNSAIRLRFSDFPDPATATRESLRLEGPRPGELLIEVELVEREIVLRPAAGLQPNAIYSLRISEALRSLAGAALSGAEIIRFQTGSVDAPAEPAPEAPTLAQLLQVDPQDGKPVGLFARRCASPGCHGSAAAFFAARGLDLSRPVEEVRRYLTTTVALGTPEGLKLVEEGRPESSYLFRKLLAHDGFVRTEGDPMPPGKLTEDELRSLGRWIRQGAR